MFFEGSEKKAEIVVKATQISLLDDIEDDFVENFELLSQNIVSTVSPTMGSRGRCPPEKEKKRIDQSIRLFQHKAQ